MRFRIEHTTHYHYASPASESFMEVRLQPPSNERQTVFERSLEIAPACRVSPYTDYFGNTVEQFSIIHRHDALDLMARTVVDTHPAAVPPAALDLTISEARQIYRSQPLRHYDFLHASAAVALDRRVHDLAKRMFPPTAHFGEAVQRSMQWVSRRFIYAPGSTHVGTTVSEALAQRRGVCQDFAHVLIAILRSAEIPARYVCGYIETETQRQAAQRGERFLVGAAESHAWVEVALPNGDWLALDPTNNIVAGERHVFVAAGRDFNDTSPTRGVFKGAGRTGLKVTVHMQRIEG